MNPDTKKHLHDRYVTLIAERDQFLAAANQKLGEYTGRLAELEMFLASAPSTHDKRSVQDSINTVNGPDLLAS